MKQWQCVFFYETEMARRNEEASKNEKHQKSIKFLVSKWCIIRTQHTLTFFFRTWVFAFSLLEKKNKRQKVFSVRVCSLHTHLHTFLITNKCGNNTFDFMKMRFQGAHTQHTHQITSIDKRRLKMSNVKTWCCAYCVHSRAVFCSASSSHLFPSFVAFWTVF